MTQTHPKVKVYSKNSKKLNARRKITMIREAILGLGCLTMTACQTQFEQPTQNYNFGTKPQTVPENIKMVFGPTLKDADSARYQFGDLKPAHCNNGLISGGKLVWTGWVLPMSVNAKNSYGGYVGFKRYFVRYEAGELLDVSPADTLGTWAFSPQLGIGCKLNQ